MSSEARPTDAKDKLLFTPGPLTTSPTVKHAMQRDLGSRDSEFIDIVQDIRRRLVDLAHGEADYQAIPMQGSGTFAIESVISSTIPSDGKLLVAVNGAYGKRIVAMAEIHRIECEVLEVPEDSPIDAAMIQKALADSHGVSHVAIVHCETTTGIMNPLDGVAEVVHQHGALLIVDAMSSFGAVPIDLRANPFDYVISSANKCIEGVPGFGFVLARTTVLETTEGLADSLSLDLHAQWKGLEANGQFRFTPPTHTLLAFHQALLELEAEGGPEGRATRYQENYRTLVEGMQSFGFVEYLPADLQGYIITSFRYPTHTNFNFDTFYDLLQQNQFVIYPGKLTHADCFRIGTIGRLDSSDVRALLGAIGEVLGEMGIELPTRSVDTSPQL